MSSFITTTNKWSVDHDRRERDSNDGVCRELSSSGSISSYGSSSSQSVVRTKSRNGCHGKKDHHDKSHTWLHYFLIASICLQKYLMSSWCSPLIFCTAFGVILPIHTNERKENRMFAHQISSGSTAKKSFPSTADSSKRRKASVDKFNHDVSYKYNHSLEFLLQDYGYGSRTIHLSKSQLPIWAEVQDDGAAKICQIVDILIERNNTAAPKLHILQLEGHSQKIVDIGQVTTAWMEPYRMDASDTLTTTTTTSLTVQAPQIQAVLENMYQSRVGRGRDSNSGLTKKQIGNISQQTTKPETTAQILRQLIKTGPKFARLIDSNDIVRELINNNSSSSQPTSFFPSRTLVAQLLAHPSFNGGRFKRWPCLWLASHHDTHEEPYVSLINGGWLVVDRSIRASTEGEQFAKQQQNVSNDDTQNIRTVNHATEDRIAQRLECLAMGEGEQDGDYNTTLEVDVRSTLRTMDLPATSEGAKQALIRMGKWSTTKKNVISPWSLEVLEAAEWYQHFHQKRRKHQSQELVKRQNQSFLNHYTHKDNAVLENRVDLTHQFCFCVDAAKTTFRDDAIGIRSRSSTGRKVNTDASKWEILVHIADVSDIYLPYHASADSCGLFHNDASGHFLQTLQQAAASRGTSRYDLPIGPIHMLPPVVLESLSLEVFKPDWTSSQTFEEQQQQEPEVIDTTIAVNRCVTVWLYIDERSGKLLDFGVERTLVSLPVALSFEAATAMLENDFPKHISIEKIKDPMVIKLQTMLKVIDRNIQAWKEYHRSTSKTAQARDERLSSYEQMSRYVYGNGISNYSNNNKNNDRHSSSSRIRDDGKDGFVRTRGHALVDASMEMYGWAMTKLVHKAGGHLPYVVGAHRDGRVGTGPLRRYIDGVSQRQALAVLFGGPGRPLSRAECLDLGMQATETLNRMNRITSSMRQNNNKHQALSSTNLISLAQQKEAVRLLTIQMRTQSKSTINNIVWSAMSTGRGSEVLLLDVGAVATCRGIAGTYKPGTKLKVQIQKIDQRTGTILAVLNTKESE